MISSPLTTISPLVGSFNLFKQRIKVDLPEPLKPTMTNSSVSSISKLTSFKAMVVFVSCLMSSSGNP